MKFCANVSILFKEVPFLERFERAAAAGFAAVEFWWPAGEALDEVEAAIRGRASRSRCSTSTPARCRRATAGC